MLETLVSSRIRRTLFEYILLLHHGDRFYLRGLAKTLQLPVSPLRRELKRLEQAGMLTAVAEGNILFYTVNTASPGFVQLQHASLPAEVSLPADYESRPPRPAREAGRGGGPAHSPQPILVGTVASQPRSLWSSPLRHPVLLGAAGVGMALIVITVSLVYLGMTNHRLVSQASRALSAKKTEVTVVVPPTPAMMIGGPGQASASGTMRGSRWQIVPGGFGGFSSATNSESF